MNVGELVAYLQLDDSKYRKALDKANAVAAGFGRTIAAAGAGTMALGAGVQVVGGLAAALGTAAGAALVLPAAFVAVKVATAAATIGMQGFGDAMAALDDPTAFAEAIEGLAPAAREAAVAVRDQKGAWDALQLDVQQQLFEGMGKHVTRLGNTYLPILRTALRGTAADLNYAGQNVAKVFENEAAATTMTTSLGYVREAIGNVTGAAGPLAQVLLDVFAVGAEFLPNLTFGAQDAAQGFADMVSRMRETGELHGIISRGLSALGDLGQIAGNVGSIIGGIFRAASVDGGSFLTTLKNSTQAISDMVNSVQGQEALTTFFQTAATLSGLFMEALSALLPVLPPLVAVLGTLAVNIGTMLVGALTAMAPYLEAFARWLQENPGLVMGFAIALGVLVVALNGLLAVAKIVGVVQAIMASGFLGMIASAVATAASWVISWATMAASALISAASMAASWIVAMGPIGWVIAAVVGLVALIIANWDTIVAWTSEAWANVSRFISEAWNNITTWVSEALANIGRFFSDGWNNAVRLARDGWNNIVNSVRTGVDAVLTWMRGLPGQILGALGDLGRLLWDAGSNIIRGLWEGIRSRGSWLMGQIMGFIRSFVPGPVLQFLGIASPSKLFRDDIGRWIPEGLADGILANARVAGDAARQLARETAAGAQAGVGSSFTVSAGVGPSDDEVAHLLGGGPGAAGAGVSISIYNPQAERSSDAIGRAGSVLAATGPWGDD